MAKNPLIVPVFSHPEPDLQFLASETNIYDYAALYGFAQQLSNDVKPYTFSIKSPLLIISESSDELVFLIAAAFLLKIPILTIHPESSDDDIQHILSQLDPPCVYTDQKKRINGLTSLPQISIDPSWLDEESGWNSEIFSLEDSELTAGLFLTSGSTGTPKIVPVKRRQVFFATQASAENFKPGQNRYWLLCLPLNHIGGISIIYRSLLYQSAIFRMDRFDVKEVRIFLSENKLFEIASLVPTMLIRILEDPLFQIHSSFKAILLGGGPITVDLLDLAMTRGIPVVSSYGMTETCAQIAANPMLRPSGVYNPKTSAGRIFAPNQIQIRDDSGNSLPPIEEGQIWLKGPQVFDGYLNQNINRIVFDDDGWFNTGDFGHLNRNNQLFIKSRRTDLIITGGENVDPISVENELNKLPEIKESAVFGVEDLKWGQRIIAFIVTSDSKVNSNNIKEFLKKNLRGFQIPKEIILVDTLPKTGLGKIKRSSLVAMYANLKKP